MLRKSRKLNKPYAVFIYSRGCILIASINNKSDNIKKSLFTHFNLISISCVRIPMDFFLLQYIAAERYLFVPVIQIIVPYAVDASAKTVLDSTGNGTLNFLMLQDFTAYCIVIHHRN